MTNAKQFDSSDFEEEWMKQFFDDPFVLYDETLPIDLYETSTEYIIETELSNVTPAACASRFPVMISNLPSYQTNRSTKKR